MSPPPRPSAPRLRSVQFRREREAAWLELSELVARVEARGLSRLEASELLRLPRLYRAALSSLSVARAISLDKNVVDYLEQLCGRAAFCIYGSKRHLREALGEFFLRRLPQAVRALAGPLALAALFLAAGALTGYLLTLGEPEHFNVLVDPAYAGGRGPTSSTAELRDALYDVGSTGEALVQFAMFLFTHNARIGILAFALGFAFGVPTLLLMFSNGCVLGAFAGLYAQRGLGVELWAWVLPHGVTELTAVVLCGGAGLVLGRSLLFPGERTRLANLAVAGRQAAVLVMGAVVMFFVAGLIEGVFRQVVHAQDTRMLVALATAVFWAAYFGLVGRVGAGVES